LPLRQQLHDEAFIWGGAMFRQLLTFAGVITVLAIVAGCREKGPEFAPVKGVVRINGTPERGLLVRFAPDPAKGNGLPAFATGKTDDQGKYTMKYDYRGKEGDGAPVGWYRAAIHDSKVGFTPQGQASKPSAVPQAYGNAATTPLVVEVKPGDNSIDLDVKK
jgi:hypothetical protein